jgi:hypothetical protein
MSEEVDTVALAALARSNSRAICVSTSRARMSNALLGRLAFHGGSATETVHVRECACSM